MSAMTVDIPGELLDQARTKARRENLSVDEVLRHLLARWVVEDREPAEPIRQTILARARASRGIWRDRDPDQFLTESRAGLKKRDEDLQSARLDAR